MKKIWFIALASILLGTVSCDGDDPVEETFYTVSFDADGGTPAPAAQKVKAGETAAAPANPARTGYAFLYWSLSGATAAYNFQTPVNNNFTLTAKWEEEAKVEYWQVSWTLNGGAWPSGDNHATQVVKGGTLAEPAEPVKSGSTFDGWYKESALTNKVTFPYDVSNVTGNITLYAKWKTEGGEPAGTFTSIAALKTWLESQPANTAETPYKVGLKGVNLDANNGWGNLGLAVKGTKFVDLDLSGCTGATIPDGYKESTPGKYPGEFTTTTYGAFVGCNYIVAVTLPQGLKTIGKWAFYKCSGLNTVSAHDGLTEIHDYAFHESNISSMNFPEGMKIIGSCAFEYTKLTSATIPGSVTDIGSSAFYRCTSLSTLVINEGVESVGQSAFYYCNSIQSLTLPQSLKTIGREAFRNCNSMKSISLPTGLTTIPEGVFSECAGLTSINIPDRVKTIEQSAFSNCSSLTDVALPSNLISIGNNAFEGCVKLTSIEIPSKVSSIGDRAFFNMASNSFTFVMRPATPPTLGSSALLAGNFTNLVVKVPTASVNAYKTASGWSAYSAKIVANTN